MNAASRFLGGLPAESSAWDVVDRLVPEWADLAMLHLLSDGRLHLVAFAHLDPLQASALQEFQALHAPPVDDPVSVVARVFRTGVPELLSPEELARVVDRIPNAGTRAALRALGPRTTLVARIADERADSMNAKGVLVTAMSSSGRRVDDDDLQTLAAISQGLATRLHR